MNEQKQPKTQEAKIFMTKERESSKEEDVDMLRTTSDYLEETLQFV